MRPEDRTKFGIGWTAACNLLRLTALLLLLPGAATRSEGQSAAALAQVQKVFVEPFEQGAEAEPLRQSLVKQLARSGRYQVVPAEQDADAILKGGGEVWLRGYLTVNPRTPASDRQPVYGGYLSVELTSPNGEPLWSYLVTPSKFTFLKVRDDLAHTLVKQMLAAAEQAGKQAAPSPGSSPIVKLAQTELVGAGATFPAPLYSRWFASFRALHPEIQIRYREIGSQAGVAALQAAAVDFAASDLPPAADGMPDARVRRIASVLGAVVPVYHLKGVNRDLHFTPEVLAKIYLGQIRRWNDRAIQNLNRDADLPDAEIAVIHRSDGSGTTYAWSGYLAMTNAEWKTQLGVGTQLKWPVGTGVEGNEKMATTVQSTPNSLGYVELVFAIQHHLSYGSVRNQAGEFIHADLDSLAEAARPFAAAEAPILDAPGKNAYPIATFTWLLLPVGGATAAKQAALDSLLEWMLRQGQQECASLGYAPLPRSVAEEQLTRLKAKR